MKISKGAFYSLLIISLTSFVLIGILAFAVSHFNESYDRLYNMYNDLNNRFSDINASLDSVNNSIDSFENSIDSFENSIDNGGDNQGSGEKTVYILKEYNGIIGVFDERGNLMKTINTAVSSLSAQDREQLTHGIITTSNEELAGLIEDLS